MAHTPRGEVEVTGVGGDRYRFRLGTGAICQLEEHNLDVTHLFSQLQEGQMRMVTVREFVKASSVDRPGMSNDDANVIIDDVGVVRILEAMAESIVHTFNIHPNGNGASGNPQKPARKKGTGAGNSRMPPK